MTQLWMSHSWIDDSPLYFQWMLRKFHWKSSMKNQHRNKVELPALHRGLLIIWKLSFTAHVWCRWWAIYHIGNMGYMIWLIWYDSWTLYHLWTFLYRFSNCCKFRFLLLIFIYVGIRFGIILVFRNFVFTEWWFKCQKRNHSNRTFYGLLNCLWITIV